MTEIKNLKLIISLTVTTAVLCGMFYVYFVANSHEVPVEVARQLGTLPQNIDLKFLQGIVSGRNTL